MPFIAIAVFVSVLLGGGAYASQTEQGQTVVHSVTKFWHEKTTSDDEASLNATSTAEVDAHGALRIRSDADDEAKALDDKLNADANAHVETQGEVHVNIF